MGKSNYHRTHLGQHELHPETQMMSYGYDPSLSEGSVKPPIFLTSTFVSPTAEDAAAHFDFASGRRTPSEENSGGLIYSRINHPNLEMVEDRLALLDGSSAAVVTSSGMAAIATVLIGLLQPGDLVLRSVPLYGGSESLISGMLKGWGIQTVHLPSQLYAEALDTCLDEASQLGRLAMVYFETPANPTNDMIDIRLLAETLAVKYSDAAARPLTVCDNTLLGPLYQQPSRFGIDLCVYSLTKYVGGHSDLVAGGITGKTEYIDKLRSARTLLGTQLDPHTCWMIARSMETLALRVERAASSASKVASWLAGNKFFPCSVLHPEHDLDDDTKTVYSAQCRGIGSTFSFVLAGDEKLAFRILNELSLFKLAVSLGGSESLACHPASTTHSGLPPAELATVGVSAGLIRLSIGLEDPSDLIADLEHAFSRVAEAVQG